MLPAHKHQKMGKMSVYKSLCSIPFLRVEWSLDTCIITYGWTILFLVCPGQDKALHGYDIPAILSNLHTKILANVSPARTVRSKICGELMFSLFDLLCSCCALCNVGFLMFGLHMVFYFS